MKANIKKLLITIIITFIVVLIPQSIKGEGQTYEIEILSDTTEQIFGVEYRELVITLNTSGRISHQTINYVMFNPYDNPDHHVVVGDDYHTHYFAPANLRAQAMATNMRYFNQVEVLAGINGDFYDTSVYFPVMAHIRDYEVIHAGHTGSRTLIGFKENGEVIFDTPTHAGHQVFVENKDGARKDIQIKVDGYNRLPANEDEVIIYYDNFTELIDTNYPKLVFDTIEIKNTSSTQFFAKGTLNELTTNKINVPQYQFVLVGSPLLEEGLITEEDTVVVQQTFEEPFKDIRFAIGGNPMLVRDGNMIQGLEGENYTFRPRSAVGTKDDGTIMFVTVDGDQNHIKLDGVSIDEMAFIMDYLGATTAVNIDGGGSTTMVAYNEESNRFDVKNTPSVTGLRSNSNGIFIARGQFFDRLPPVLFPDTRALLETPENIHVSFDGTVYFDEVEGATYYEILVDGNKRYKVSGSPVKLNIYPGSHSINIKAFGDHEIKAPSYYSSGYSYFEHSTQMHTFLNGLLEYTKQSNKK